MSDSQGMADLDVAYMRRALVAAKRGEGAVEPNPMVGCVLARDARVLAEGNHERFGGPHAEVVALRNAEQQGFDARGATAYVTLEPCCHHGKTPPCSEALIQAGVQRVVIAVRDPFAQVDGGGIRQLQAAGVQVEVGLLEDEALDLLAPYLRRVVDKRPWVIAKWAMSLDGKIATSTGDSQWISSEVSRREVHQLRGRVDAILIGRGTVEADNPRLTVRPPGLRTPTRIVCDSEASLPLDSNLVQTAAETPVLVAASEQADSERIRRLEQAGCRVWQGAQDRVARLTSLLQMLAEEGMTNVMLEGGARLLGSFWKAQLIDETHVYLGPKLIGGQSAPSPIGGEGATLLQESLAMRIVDVRRFDTDVRIVARVQ